MDIIVTGAEEGMLLRSALHRAGFSSALIRSLKQKPRGILLNGEPVTVRRVLHAGEVLTLAVEDRVAGPAEPVDLPIGIVWEEESFVVVDKPAHMPVHVSHGHRDDTVANALAFRYRDLPDPYVFRPVNRLDRNTSGLVLVARNRVSANCLARAMAGHEIRKTYLAVLDGCPPTAEGEITLPLRRKGGSIMLREVCGAEEEGAMPSVTRYRVLRSGAHSLVEAYPLTGRTHQLRVHFAALGCPIHGDDLYGTEDASFPRHALHATELSFPHPQTGETMTFRSPCPDEFYALLDES